MLNSKLGAVVFAAWSTFAAPAAAAAGDLVISQVYGGGGNSGATLRSDYVELLNGGTLPVDLAGWSLQYASSTASSWQVTGLVGIVHPGSYYLVQLGGGAGGSVDLPPPDAVGTTNMSAASGKVALVADVAPLAVSCPSGLDTEDFVGYGSANCFEGAAPAPAGSNTESLVRAGDGCVDTDDNAADFATGTPSPRNRTSDPRACGAIEPTGTPTLPPSSTPTATPTTEPTASSTSTATHSPTPTATVTHSPTPTATVTQSPTRTATVTASPQPPELPTATSTAVPSVTATAPATVAPTPTATSLPVATATGEPTPLATPSPQAECGNGTIEPGEHCDDGNSVDGDSCPNGCSYQDSGSLVHGNHRRRMVRGDGCQLEWYVADSQPTFDRFGFVSQTQSCADQDPGCDAAPDTGRCRFTVVACLNNTDANLPECTPGGIASAVIVHPRDNRASTGVREANRAALQYALTHLIDPSNPGPGAVHGLPLSVDQRNLCSAPFPLDVERRPGATAAVSLIVDTFDSDLDRPRRERARLRLICTP